MNLRNRIIADILKYKYDKCSNEELLIHKKELRCKRNGELYDLYDNEIRDLKECAIMLNEHNKEFLYESFENEY